jgi:hypothetical protein
MIVGIMLSLMSLRKRVTDFMVGNVGFVESCYKRDNDSRALVMSAL